MDGFIRSYSEIECTLPIIGGTAILKGVIDLLLVFEDRIEVHDYKTDETDRFQREYEIQLSAYALAAGGFYRGLPVRCFIDYVSQGRTVEIEPLSQEELAQCTAIRRELGTQFCRRCGYCAPCPNGIDIPSCFLMANYTRRYGLADWARARYEAMPYHAGSCVMCGACEKRCPYGLPIRDMLMDVAKVFGR